MLNRRAACTTEWTSRKTLAAVLDGRAPDWRRAPGDDGHRQIRRVLARMPRQGPAAAARLDGGPCRLEIEEADAARRKPVRDMRPERTRVPLWFAMRRSRFRSAFAMRWIASTFTSGPHSAPARRSSNGHRRGGMTPAPLERHRPRSARGLLPLLARQANRFGVRCPLAKRREANVARRIPQTRPARPIAWHRKRAATRIWSPDGTRTSRTSPTQRLRRGFRDRRGGRGADTVRLFWHLSVASSWRRSATRSSSGTVGGKRRQRGLYKVPATGGAPSRRSTASATATRPGMAARRANDSCSPRNVGGTTSGRFRVAS
jgi:hypothetical protein